MMSKVVMTGENIMHTVLGFCFAYLEPLVHYALLPDAVFFLRKANVSLKSELLPVETMMVYKGC